MPAAACCSSLPAEAIRSTSFLARHDAAVYHPAGTHVVSSGLARRGGSNGLWVATNRGSNPRLLARGETATSISNLVFTANHQLLFVADYGDHKDLHQLDLTNEKLVTAATIGRPTASRQWSPAGLRAGASHGPPDPAQGAR